MKLYRAIKFSWKSHLKEKECVMQKWMWKIQRDPLLLILRYKQV